MSTTGTVAKAFVRQHWSHNNNKLLCWYFTYFRISRESLSPLRHGFQQLLVESRACGSGLTPLPLLNYAANLGHFRRPTHFGALRISRLLLYKALWYRLLWIWIAGTDRQSSKNRLRTSLGCKQIIRLRNARNVHVNDISLILTSFPVYTTC